MVGRRVVAIEWVANRVLFRASVRGSMFLRIKGKEGHVLFPSSNPSIAMSSPRIASSNTRSTSPNVWYAQPDLSMGEVIPRFDRTLKPQGYPKAPEVWRQCFWFVETLTPFTDQGGCQRWEGDRGVRHLVKPHRRGYGVVGRHKGV